MNGIKQYIKEIRIVREISIQLLIMGVMIVAVLERYNDFHENMLAASVCLIVFLTIFMYVAMMIKWLKKRRQPKLNNSNEPKQPQSKGNTY